MKQSISETIEVPKEIEVEVGDRVIKMKKDGNELERKYSGFDAKKEDSKIILSSKKATKRENRLMKTTAAHIGNMIKGLREKFIYKLQVASVHFPMSVEFNEANKEIIIKNFLGETKDRKAKILANVDVKIEKDIITLESFDKEAVGQSAANIETATKIKAKDRRVFQDGIFITEKAKGRQKK